MIDSTALSEVLMKKHQGELLTIAEAVTGDKVQRDAIKSLIRQSCQKCCAELTSRLGSPATPQSG